MKKAYIANDGTTFYSERLCREYEESIFKRGRGVVGEARKNLEVMGDYYVHGLVLVVHDGKFSAHNFTTMCLDKILQRYTKVGKLKEEERFLTATFDDVLKVLEKYDDEDFCEYYFFYSKEKSLNGKGGVCRMTNDAIWQKIDKEENKP